MANQTVTTSVNHDEKRDAFIPPQPFKSWKVNEHSCLWEPSVHYPNDGFIYNWNKDTQKWEKVGGYYVTNDLVPNL